MALRSNTSVNALARFEAVAATSHRRSDGQWSRYALHGRS